MRIAMGVEYDGSDFLGWQMQAQGRTVQASLERALSAVADQSIVVHGAGRTDAGVHAREQVLHFDTDAQRSTRAWVLGANGHLPADVAVLWARHVATDFHARFAATARRYRYVLLNRRVRPAIERHGAAWYRKPLDAAAMHSASQALVGEHDFTSFRALACQARHAIRRIDEIAVRRLNEHLEIVVEGNGFLHHMVRNIVGTLLVVGCGDASEAHMAEVLRRRDRSAAGPTAAALGLTLERVRYPPSFNIPRGAEPL